MVRIAPWTWILGSALLSLSSFETAKAETCAKTYSRVIPYDLPLGGEQASINLHNELRFSYNCQTLLTEAEAQASAQFLQLDLDLLQAELSAVQTLNQPSVGYARLTVAGFEVAREDFDLENIYETTLSPDTDFDFSETQYLNVGPLVIPLNYGVEGNAALEVKLGWKDLGLEADVSPLADAKVYVQADANLQLAQVLARGDMILLQDRLQNTLRAAFEDDGQLFLRLSAQSENDLKALEGSVFVRAQLGTGAGAKTFERQLFAWPGIEQKALIAEFSDRFPLLD